MGLDLGLHVVVGVLHLHLDGGGAVLLVEVGGDEVDALLPGLEAVPVVVPDDEAQPGLGLVALHVAQVEEALVALGVGGGLRRRQHVHELQSHEAGVAHLVLGGAGVDVEAPDGDLGGGGVEVLVLQLPQLAAVHGVGRGGAEALHVEVVGAAAHLLVGGDGHGDAAVGDLGVGGQILHGGEDLSHAGLVVGAQQGGAVGDDEVLAHIPGQAGELRGPHGHGVGEGNVPALVVDHTGLDVGAGGGGRGIHVGNEAQTGDPLTAYGGGEPAVDVAILVHFGTVEAHLGELLGQGGPQDLLLVRGRHSGGIFAGLGIIRDVPQKTLSDMHERSNPFCHAARPIDGQGGLV